MEGNSEVRDGQILSCGDYNEQTGKYDIRIFNGVSVVTISLDEPLRKVGDVADNIEFPTDTPNTARVTRKIGSVDIGSQKWIKQSFSYDVQCDRFACQTINKSLGYYNILTEYPQNIAIITNFAQVNGEFCSGNNNNINVYISQLKDKYLTANDFANAHKGKMILFELATPTTSYVSVPTIQASNTYTPMNMALGWSAFTYDSDKVIMSCGDLQDDGKYHIMIKADSKVIDIPLDEPLRKVGDVGDTIEFPTNETNTARVTRMIGEYKFKNPTLQSINSYGIANFHLYSDGQYNFRKSILDEMYNLGIRDVQYTTIANTTTEGYFFSSTDYLYIRIKSDRCKNVAEFNALFDAFKYYAVLTTPITSNISIPSIPLAKGYTCENEVPFSEFSAESVIQDIYLCQTKTILAKTK